MHFNSHFNTIIGKSTLSEILSSKKKFSNEENITAKRLRTANHPELEECVFLWHCEMQSKHLSISLDMPESRAIYFGTLFISTLPSPGWIQNFKSRFGLSSHKTSGESVEHNLKDVQKLKESILKDLENYEPNDIFNLDETTLFYRLQPSQTLSTDTVAGTKTSKERLTVAVIVNSTGSERIKPIVIGKSKRPRCFGKIWNPNSVVSYFNNQTAWMTINIFSEWLLDFNRKMKLQRRKVFN